MNWYIVMSETSYKGGPTFVFVFLSTWWVNYINTTFVIQNQIPKGYMFVISIRPHTWTPPSGSSFVIWYNRQNWDERSLLVDWTWIYVSWGHWRYRQLGWRGTSAMGDILSRIFRRNVCFKILPLQITIYALKDTLLGQPHVKIWKVCFCHESLEDYTIFLLLHHLRLKLNRLPTSGI